MRPAAIALAGALLSGCGGGGGAEQALAGVVSAGAPPDDAVRVEVATLEASDATLALSLPGEIEGWRDARLAAALGGFVEQVDVRVGDEVRRGKGLARVDASLRKAELDQAELRLEQARSDLERLKGLGDLASPARLQAASTAATLAESAAAQARVRFSRALVTAPFDGVVAEVGVERGEVAPPGQPILRLVAVDPVKVTLAVADKDVVLLEPGMSATVTAPAVEGGRTGTVSSVGPAANLKTRAFPVELRVPNPVGDLLPGMVARVRIDRPLDRDAVLIPQDLLISRGQEQGVFVEQDRRASWRPVRLGTVVGDSVVVTGGLEPGERVVVTGHRELVDGESLLVAREGTCCESGRVHFGDR